MKINLWNNFSTHFKKRYILKFLLLIIYIDYCGSTVSLNGCKEYTTVGTSFGELKIEGYNALIQNFYTLLNECMARTQKIDVNELLPVLAGS